MNYSFLSVCLPRLPTEIIDIVLHYYGKKYTNNDNHIFAEQLNLDKYKILSNIPKVTMFSRYSWYVQLHDWRLSVSNYKFYKCYYLQKNKIDGYPPVNGELDNIPSYTIYYHNYYEWIDGDFLAMVED